jgi:hypothetical protein
MIPTNVILRYPCTRLGSEMLSHWDMALFDQLRPFMIKDRQGVPSEPVTTFWDAAAGLVGLVDDDDSISSGEMHRTQNFHNNSISAAANSVAKNSGQQPGTGVDGKGSASAETVVKAELQTSIICDEPPDGSDADVIQENGNVNVNDEDAESASGEGHDNPDDNPDNDHEGNIIQEDDLNSEEARAEEALYQRACKIRDTIDTFYFQQKLALRKQFFQVSCIFQY